MTGEVGCGKSSLLNSGIRNLLEHSGYEVVFVRTLPELHRARATDVATSTFEPIRALVERAPSEKQVVLIIDQFEEFLVEFPSAVERQQLGAFLNDPVAGRTVRVLCAIRSDYVIDMHDLAPALPEPLATQSLFPIKNFTVSEATDIILECAQRDSLKIKKDLAELIASDLTHSARVRPPELQLVCTALADDTSEKHYRVAGGAKGILSDYVKNAIQFGPDTELGRLVLRALCDFQLRRR